MWCVSGAAGRRTEVAEVIHVDDRDDPALVEVAGLKDADARARTEARHGCFVVEGILALESVLSSPYPLRSVLVAEPKLHRVLPLVDHLDIPVHVGSPDLLEVVTGFAIHRGIVASAGRLPLPRPEAVLSGARQVAVLEAVNDHENIGALFRNAAAFGIDAVLLDPTTADPLYRRSVRVSLGHVLHVPWARMEPWPDGLAVVRDAGFRVLALSPAGPRTVAEAVADTSDPIAWLLGAEGPGLSDVAVAAADEQVRIPIAEGVDSLNVATAAAVAFALNSPQQ